MATPRKRPTSVDVAKRAGVSRATVSMVLNDRTEGTVSEATRERVLAAARELKYTRSKAALNLREQRTRTIGIVTDEIMTSPWAGRMLRAANQAAFERDYFTLSVDRSIQGMTQEVAIRTLLERDVDAIMIATMGTSRVMVPVDAAPVPIALLNCVNTIGLSGASIPPDFTTETRFGQEDNAATVTATGPTLYPEFIPDDYAGAYRATQRLIEVGHERITMVTAADEVIARTARNTGFADACTNAGLRPRFVVAGWNFDDGFRAGARLFAADAGERPTAVFCLRDRVAAGVIQAAAVAGLEVSRDVSVVGFDDEDFFAERLVPRLTTMALPHIDMGEAAMGALIDAIEGSAGDVAERLIFSCPLVERESIASPLS